MARDLDLAKGFWHSYLTILLVQLSLAVSCELPLIRSGLLLFKARSH